MKSTRPASLSKAKMRAREVPSAETNYLEFGGGSQNKRFLSEGSHNKRYNGLRSILRVLLHVESSSWVAP